MRPKKLYFLLFPILFFLFLQIPSLAISNPEKTYFSSLRLNLLEDVIREAVNNEEIPGAVILVGHKENIVFRRAFGWRQIIPEPKPMEVDLLFDLASLTKPVATATSVMILVEKGKLSLQDKVKDYVPGFTSLQENSKKVAKNARLWHLLTHTSGLPPYTEAAVVEKKYGKPCPLKNMVEHIAGLKKTSAPGKEFIYSCLGYITLAYIIEQVSGKNIAEFSSNNIFKPLNMTKTSFTPDEDKYPFCVPTQVIDGKLLQGVVHDPLAKLLGGISGNAGLFSSADDLALFAQMLLKGGELNGRRILSPLSIRRMTEVYPEVKFSGRGLGWDVDSPYSTAGG
ncbi:MAG: serine hydrolase domain-containing protein, partial [Acidobacteriota bacterium]